MKSKLLIIPTGLALLLLSSCTFSVTTRPDGTVEERKEFDREAFADINQAVIEHRKADSPNGDK